MHAATVACTYGRCILKKALKHYIVLESNLTGTCTRGIISKLYACCYTVQVHITQVYTESTNYLE